MGEDGVMRDPMPGRPHSRPTESPAVSPKDRFITVYGRNPVLEALTSDGLAVDKVLLADTARGPHVSEILNAARRAGVRVQRVSAE